MLDPTKVTSSGFSGFKNYTAKNFSVDIPNQSIGVGNHVTYTTSTTLDNTNSVSQLQVQYSGLETFWRVVPGQLAVDYPSWGASAQYQIETQLSFSGTTLTATIYVINEKGTSTTIPDITVNCRAFLFLAPF